MSDSVTKLNKQYSDYSSTSVLKKLYNTSEKMQVYASVLEKIESGSEDLGNAI